MYACMYAYTYVCMYVCMYTQVFQKLDLKIGAGLAVTFKKTMALTCGGNPIVAERVKEGSGVR